MSALLAAWLLACSGAPAPVDNNVPDTDVDTDPDDTAPPDTAAIFCDGAPTLAYTNFGEGFLRESCQGCHASTTPDRFGAPDTVTFDTVDEAWAWSARILVRSTGDAPTMPPQGGVSADDRTRLAWWLRCGTPGT